MAATSDTIPKLLRGTYNKWTKDGHGVFISWWETTAVGTDFKKNPGKRGHPNWDSDQRQGKFWPCFDQCARVRTGEAVVVCKVCSSKFVHTNTNNNGTKAMLNHSKKCLPLLGTGQHLAGQKTLIDMAAKVCSSCLYYVIIHG
jgi:hypothetical protein